MRSNFFAVVDKWQAELILSEHAKTFRSVYGSSSTSTKSLVSLPPSIAQLFFAEPSLLENHHLSALLDSTVSIPSSRSGPVTALGLTPALVRLLSSSNQSRRNWALAQLPATSRRPLSLKEWRDNGIGDEVQRLYHSAKGEELKGKWFVVNALLCSDSLSQEAVRDGLLGGCKVEGSSQRSELGLMAVLSGLLGSEADGMSSCVGIISLILS